MEKYRITITEKEKLIGSFNLANFRDEVVNFMYKKTVADSSRKSLIFYIAVFFLSVKNGEKSLMRDLFDKNIGKLRKLNKLLSQKKRLKKGEYAELVNQAGLTDVFRYDIFFLLVSAVVDADELKETFKSYLQSNRAVSKEFDSIVSEYRETFAGFREEFSQYLLIDDRWDDRGHYQDLSKSVMRPVKMRTSRNVDYSLHKYAELKKIKSDSPVVLEVIQNIHPDMLMGIWEVYNLDIYAKGAWNFLNSPLVSGIGGGILAGEWLRWRSLNGRTQKKEKASAKKSLDIAKTNAAESGETDRLLSGVVKSLLASNEYLQAEIERVRKELEQVRSESSLLVNRDKEIAALEERLAKLENIDISVKKEK